MGESPGNPDDSSAKAHVWCCEGVGGAVSAVFAVICSFVLCCVLGSRRYYEYLPVSMLIVMCSFTFRLRLVGNVALRPFCW